MASKITLHIGLQKSGTTYLQSILGRCAGELPEIGVLYPTGDKTIETHERVLYGLLGTEFPWVTEERARNYRSQGNGWSARSPDGRDGCCSPQRPCR